MMQAGNYKFKRSKLAYWLLILYLLNCLKCDWTLNYTIIIMICVNERLINNLEIKCLHERERIWFNEWLPTDLSSTGIDGYGKLRSRYSDTHYVGNVGLSQHSLLETCRTKISSLYEEILILLQTSKQGNNILWSSRSAVTFQNVKTKMSI